MKSLFLFALRIIGVALLIMSINVLLSVVEVFIYSCIVPARPSSFYNAHALQSAPWVSGIAGGLLMYIFTRYYILKNPSRHLLYALLLPTLYILIDISIIIAMQADLEGNYHVYIIANLSKFAGAIIAYFLNPK